jgi:uptake hydrogenase large subunit
MVKSFDPGQVRLHLKILGGRVGGSEVLCTRPEVTRILRGQPADTAVALVPLIYSLCGKAQGIAARAALAAARGNVVEAHVDAEALAEAAREHAWKLFIDWPKQLGLAPDEAYFVRLVRRTPSELAEAAEVLRAHPLPDSLRAALGAGEIDGLLRERIEMRLKQLSDWLAGKAQTLGTVSADSVGPGIGEARVETARGTLVHRLALAGDAIADYTITAPTDVHFAPAGDAARWLETLRGLPEAEAGRQAARLVMVFDPCVPWVCELD